MIPSDAVPAVQAVQEPPRFRSAVVAAAALFAAAVHAAFLAQRPFFFADDFGCLADADNLTRGTSGFFTLPAWGAWRLGQRALWLAEYRIFGLEAFPYHAVNVALHAAAAAALAALLMRLGAERLRALAASLLFASWSIPSMTVEYPSVSAVIVATLAVFAAVAAHDAGRPVLASLALLAGACFYEQALCAPAAMLLVNVLRRRRPWWAGLPLPAAAAAGFFVVNFWTLRGTTKIFAYNAGGTRALQQAVFVPLRILDPAELFAPPVFAWSALALFAAAVCLSRGMRAALPGLAFAWIAVAPLLGRNVRWSDWYFYMPAAGVAAAVALAFPRSRAWLLAPAVLLAWNLHDQRWRSRYFVEQAERYRQVTLTAPPASDAAAVVLVNIHSGLAWSGWQFGGAFEAVELWQSDEDGAACFTGPSLAEARQAMLRIYPRAVRRSGWPADMPPGLRNARGPARHALFPWPAAGQRPPQ